MARIGSRLAGRWRRIEGMAGDDPPAGTFEGGGLVEEVQPDHPSPTVHTTPIWPDTGSIRSSSASMRSRPRSGRLAGQRSLSRRCDRSTGARPRPTRGAGRSAGSRNHRSRSPGSPSWPPAMTRRMPGRGGHRPPRSPATLFDTRDRNVDHGPGRAEHRHVHRPVLVATAEDLSFDQQDRHLAEIGHRDERHLGWIELADLDQTRLVGLRSCQIREDRPPSRWSTGRPADPLPNAVAHLHVKVEHLHFSDSFRFSIGTRVGEGCDDYTVVICFGAIGRVA